MFILIAPLSGAGNDNPSARLAEIRGKITTAEKEVRSIEADLTDAIVNNSGPNTDANALRQKLYQARAFEGELRTAENFWNDIVDNNKKAEDKTKDHFKAA